MEKPEAFGTFYAIVIFFILTLPGQAIAQNDHTNPNQSQDEIVRINTNLVIIPITVMDRSGRYITDLKKEDFQIFEDGIEQELAFFETANCPLTVLFLVDVSSSMSPHRDRLFAAINALAAQLHPEDRMMVATFFQWTDWLLETTKVSEKSRAPLKINIRKDADCPSTYIYNAVNDALEKMKKIEGRKAIFLFSDGEGSGFGITAGETLHKAEEQGAIIYSFKFGTYPTEPPPHVSRKSYFERIERYVGYMRDLARKTGGRYYQVEELSDLERTFNLATDELRRQYILGYYPRKQSAVNIKKRIRVKVRVPDLVVIVRDNRISKDRVY
jgi:Ca-activated chloride channel family protein